ncbi:MAG: TraV family lipoprotein [Gammaproteobacteria bacterium]|nr:TraV family lipoprotein [Gammaproteobacteria bacterium]
MLCLNFSGWLSGCSLVSGLDSAVQFSCPAPDGVSCTSVSTLFTNLFPPKSTDRPVQDVPPKMGLTMLPSTVATQNVITKSKERTLRIWVAPYKDQEGDLYDQHYIYVSVAPGIWSIPANPPIPNKIAPTIHSLNKNHSSPEKPTTEKPKMNHSFGDHVIDSLPPALKSVL